MNKKSNNLWKYQYPDIKSRNYLGIFVAFLRISTEGNDFISKASSEAKYKTSSCSGLPLMTGWCRECLTEASTFGANKNTSIRIACTTYMLTNTGRRLIEYTRFICTADDARIRIFSQFNENHIN